MAGLVPRLSGLAEVPLKRQLSGVNGGWSAVVKAVEGSAVQQIGAHQAGEGKRAGDCALPGLGHAQQQKGDQRDGDLDAHGIFADPEKVADFEDLSDQRKNSSIAQRRL